LFLKNRVRSNEANKVLTPYRT